MARERHRHALAPRLADERGAPALWVSGGTLHWSATATSHEYVESRTAGATTAYVVVAGTADTPPPAAGATVTYLVRPRYQPHKWSNEVTIAYPAGKRRHEGEDEPRREREERQAKERAEREARELAEREAKEKAEREAKEKAEREAKERAEREAKERAAKEQAEREAKEKAEREAKERAEREAKERAAKEKAEREAKERAAKEKAEQEAKERAEREAKEKAEREAKEKAEREAKEKAEREAREKAEREQREREEREHKEPPGEPSGAVVGSAPVGPPAPASGWHIAYGDGFGAPLGSGPGQDNTMQSSEKWNGCCTNSNEVAVEQHSQAHVGPEGLELVCSVGSFTVEGVTRGASCGGVRGDAFFEFNYATAGEWAVECDCRWPLDLGGADPGFWVYTGSQELDFFEGWGWGGLSWLTAHAGIPVDTSPYADHEVTVTPGLGFDPSAAFHRYTTLFSPRGGSNYLISEYIDGVFRWSFEDTIANTSDGFIITNALRHVTQPDVFTIRSVAFWQDGAHAGQGIKGGGIAPGTTVK